METIDYPALYISADGASSEAQTSLLQLNIWTSLLLLAGALLSLLSFNNKASALASAFVLLGSLALYVFSRVKDYQSKWYRARALAESIKTVTWRYMMQSEPFADDATAVDDLRRTLTQLLSQNESIGALLAGGESEQGQLTEKMIGMRGSDLVFKKDFYMEHRIKNQRSWYSTKARLNKRLSTRWFWFLFGLYSSAIACALLKVAEPDWRYLPVELFVVAASCAIAWTQLKRFDELASSFGLAAHEIGLIEMKFSSVTDSGLLATFVKEAENAFSREHTQWIARKDQAI
jgi:hypothetical protein